MSNNYSQVKAMMAITKASLIAIFRSPQAVFFSLFFPIVLVAIFGALGGKGIASVDVAFAKNTDTANVLYTTMKSIPVLNIVNGDDSTLNDKLKKGRLTAIINIQPTKNDIASSKYTLYIKTSSASQKDYPLLQSILNDLSARIDTKIFKDRPSYVSISKEIVEGREYKMIDFFLPGMIGFALIGAAVFGVAFAFYSLRDTLVLKRMYSSPIKKQYIVLGESLARVIFQLTTVVVLIFFGKYFYHFTLANGIITFINILIISFFALIVFMGFGFVISGIAKNQNVIPVYANLFMFPQYFLSGTFFPKSALPEGLQAIIKYLPLTAVNDAMRNVSFEGVSLFSCWKELCILAVWGIIVYIIAGKTFKWE
ncbi:MAG: ABC transporter permease [Bacteroidetes bacterium]|nr:ABC transporter permease [Bacteroidota bacterium]MBS1641511.1 ABC transporter permease [Bacteroidota bacterium]MBS1671640.1 ABC transporter permease [Bacteroidota bacterium]